MEKIVRLWLIIALGVILFTSCTSQRPINMGEIDTFDDSVKVVVVRIVDTITISKYMPETKGYIAEYSDKKICIVSGDRYLSDANIMTQSAEREASVIRQGKYYLVALYGPAKMAWHYCVNSIDNWPFSEKAIHAMLDTDWFVCLNMHDDMIYPVTAMSMCIDHTRLPSLNNPEYPEYLFQQPLNKPTNLCPPESYKKRDSK